MKKKLLVAFIAIIAAVCGVFGLTACGGDTGGADGTSDKLGIVYRLNGDGESYSVVGVKKVKGEEIIIPAEYNGKPVTGIGEQAFADCGTLKYVTVPESITSIGESAFILCGALEKFDYKGDIGKWCLIEGIANISVSVSLIYINGQKLVDMTEIFIPEGTTRISDYAFAYCPITSITVPDSVTSIGNYAFYRCADITSIILPDGVTGIGYSAFKDCGALTSITIPDGVKSIDEYAFSGCSLINITIPDSVTSIGEKAFESCPIEIATIPAFACEYIKNSELKTVIITSGDSIGEDAFFGFESLTSVTIPDSVKSIGDSAFGFCSSLTSITIPDSVTHIGEKAFESCPIEAATIPAFACEYINNTALKTVVITSGESIDENAFRGCSSLTSITIPDSVTHIGENAFRGCSSLTSITFPDSVTSIGDYAFYGSSIESLTIPDSLTSIGEKAFDYCSVEIATIPAFACEYIKNSELKTVVITSGNSIDLSAFTDSYTLENITVNADNETYSSQDGILYDKAQTKIIFVPKAIKGKVNIPDSVTVISYSEFSDCNKLQYNEYDNALYLGNDNNPYLVLVKAKSTSITSCNINEKTKFVQNSVFENCSSLETVSIPDGITIITNNMFRNCSSLIDMTIGSCVTRIGYNAFDGCSSLKNLTVGNGVTEIGKDAFKNCTVETATIPAIVCEYIKNYRLKTVVITDGNYIGSSALSGCSNLTSVTLPESVTSIGESAFRDCSSLTSITLPDGVTSIGNSAFRGCSKLKDITIPDEVTSIGNSAFSGCVLLARVTIGRAVARIGYEAFSACPIETATIPAYACEYVKNSKLKTVVITNGETIGNNVFKDCTSLISVSIPASVVNINSAFEGCSSLQEIKYTGDMASWCRTNGLGFLDKSKVYIEGWKLTEMTEIVIPYGATKIEASAFSDCARLTEVSIPGSVLDISATAFKGCTSLEKIKYTGDIASWCQTNGLGNLDKNKVYLGRQKFLEMTKVIIPEGVTSIGDYAFSDCVQLTEISLPDSLVNVSSTAFSGCDRLFYMENGVKYIDCLAVDMYMEPGVIYSSINIKDGTKIICAGALDWNMYNYLVIPDSVKNINDSACSGQTVLIGVTIGDGTESIGKSVFSGCSRLENVTIGSGVTSIGQWAFLNCSSLKSITFEGTMAQWEAIEKGKEWNKGTGNYTIHCTDGDIAKS